MRLLRRKRTTSSSSDADDDIPRTPTSPLEKTSPSRGRGLPLIGKIPLTPLSKTSPKSEGRSWDGGSTLIDGKYDVTSKDKSVLERISHRAHRHGARVRKPHEVCLPKILVTYPILYCMSGCMCLYVFMYFKQFNSILLMLQILMC